MEKEWKKRYSFRLKKGDQELRDILEGLADSRRSEAIRHLLLFACRTIQEEKQASGREAELQRQICQLHLLIEKQHQELLKKITVPAEAAVEPPQSRKETNERITEQALTDSAAAMFTSFGMP